MDSLIVQTSDRNDITTLPFYPLFERAKEAALQGDDKSWERAKANLLSLHQTLALSPDLTPTQAKQLFANFLEETRDAYRTALELGSLGTDELDLGSFDDEASIQDSLNKAIQILDLKF